MAEVRTGTIMTETKSIEIYFELPDYADGAEPRNYIIKMDAPLSAMPATAEYYGIHPKSSNIEDSGYWVRTLINGYDMTETHNCVDTCSTVCGLTNLYTVKPEYRNEVAYIIDMMLTLIAHGDHPSEISFTIEI